MQLVLGQPLFLCRKQYMCEYIERHSLIRFAQQGRGHHWSSQASLAKMTYSYFHSNCISLYVRLKSLYCRYICGVSHLGNPVFPMTVCLHLRARSTSCGLVITAKVLTGKGPFKVTSISVAGYHHMWTSPSLLYTPPVLRSWPGRHTTDGMHNELIGLHIA